MGNLNYIWASTLIVITYLTFEYSSGSAINYVLYDLSFYIDHIMTDILSYNFVGHMYFNNNLFSFI